MKYKIIKPENENEIIYEFRISKDEIANCEFSQEKLNEIMKLEKSPSLAHQLELLLEYFHAIEGSSRTSELSEYIRLLGGFYQNVYSNPQAIHNSTIPLATGYTKYIQYKKSKP